MDQYTEVMARCPAIAWHGPNDPCRIHFVGHSNGTYLLSKALDAYKASRFGNVTLAGSIIRRDFGWDALTRDGRVAAVRNHLASADWVVALFPRFIEDLLPGKNEVGSSGFTGFEQHEGRKYQVTFVKGAHGAALVPRNHEPIADFLLNLTPWPPEPDPEIIVKDQLPWLVTLSKFCVPTLIIAALLLLAIGFASASWGVYLVHDQVWPSLERASTWTREGGTAKYRIWLPAIVAYAAIRGFLKRY